MFDSIINYIQRNPLTTIIIVMLMVFAPSAFGALLVGIAVAVLLLLAVPIYMLFRVRRMSRKMEEQMRDNTHAGGFYNQHRSDTNSQWSQRRAQEGRVEPQRPPKTGSVRLSPGLPYMQRSLAGYSPWGCKELDTIE